MDKKVRETPLFDRSKFDSDEISEIERIQNMLDAAEIIKAVAKQSKMAPGGKLIAPKTIFVTDKRVLIKDPNMLGLRSEVDAVPYSQINNVKLEKGVFTSKVLIKSGYFNSDQQGYIDAIPKDKAAKIVSIISEGIRQAQSPTIATSSQSSDDDPLTILKRRFAKGEITREEYEDMKKALE